MARLARRAAAERELERPARVEATRREASAGPPPWVATAAARGPLRGRARRQPRRRRRRLAAAGRRPRDRTSADARSAADWRSDRPFPTRAARSVEARAA